MLVMMVMLMVVKVMVVMVLSVHTFLITRFSSIYLIVSDRTQLKRSLYLKFYQYVRKKKKQLETLAMMIICDIDCRKKQNQFYKEKTIFCSLRFVAIIEFIVIVASLLILVVTPIK